MRHDGLSEKRNMPIWELGDPDRLQQLRDGAFRIRTS